jgi:hypothetical protein
MGIRYTILTTLKLFLDQKPVYINGEGNGRILRAVNTLFNVENTNVEELPKISIVPAPETINTGLLGNILDSTYRVSIFGFVCREQHEALFEAGENLIEFIKQTLTDWDNVQLMLQSDGNGFSITEMGPILNEQMDEAGNIAYISVPLAIQFVER